MESKNNKLLSQAENSEFNTSNEIESYHSSLKNGLSEKKSGNESLKKIKTAFLLFIFLAILGFGSLTYFILKEENGYATQIKELKENVKNYQSMEKALGISKKKAKKLVVALGGNALGNTALEQLELVKKTAVPIVDLIEAGNEVVISHGNGPQVGIINLGMSTAYEAKAIKGEMPFPECGAMSQAYIGYHLQQAIGNELTKRGIKKPVSTIITQSIVDEKDEAFKKPTKPVGAFYDKETSDRLAKERGWTMIEDAGRGYRRVVPSPKPIYIVEKDSIKDLADAGHIVVCVGGGGIPVIKKEDGMLQGVPAVIDKDFGAALLAKLIEADALFILTAVDRVSIHYNKPDQKDLEEMTLAEAEQYIKDGEFAPGSMLPKVKACMEFAATGGTAIIADLANAAKALRGESGTKIHK